MNDFESRSAQCRQTLLATADLFCGSHSTVFTPARMEKEIEDDDYPHRINGVIQMMQGNGNITTGLVADGTWGEKARSSYKTIYKLAHDAVVDAKDEIEDI